jgi:hypothetical protein
VTPEVTRDVCLLARMMAANLYYSQIEDLMFEVILFQPFEIIILICLLFRLNFTYFLSCFFSCLCGVAMMSCVIAQKNFTGIPRKMKLQNTT